MKTFRAIMASALRTFVPMLVTLMALGVSAAQPTTASPSVKPSYDPTKPMTNAAPIVIPAGPILEGDPSADIARSGKGNAFIWEIKSKTTVAYLYGTIHVGKRTFYPLPATVEAAFKQSQLLVVEADISNSDGLGDIETIINYKAPDSLDKHIPAPLFERLKIQLARLNVPLEAVKPMKPFLIGGFLAVAEFSRLGYDMNFGVDGYLINKAKEDKKPILELESQAGQLRMLNEMSPVLQEAFLENAISALESGKGPDQVTGMVNAWQSGDVNLMAEVAKGVNKGMRMTDQLDEVLVHGRHAAMLKKIESYLEGKVPHFVAIGSLHLVGPRGLVEILKARGYEVKQL